MLYGFADSIPFFFYMDRLTYVSSYRNCERKICSTYEVFEAALKI